MQGLAATTKITPLRACAKGLLTVYRPSCRKGSWVAWKAGWGGGGAPAASLTHASCPAPRIPPTFEEGVVANVSTVLLPFLLPPPSRAGHGVVDEGGGRPELAAVTVLKPSGEVRAGVP